MKILHNLEDYKPTSRPVVLTIGNFDGVHLGHQKLIKKLTSYAQKIVGDSVVITFENHPSQLLNPDKSINLICSYKHKVILLEKLNVDAVVGLKFSHEFANQSAEDFLLRILQIFPLSHLILGHDARIGKGREGDRHKVMQLAQEMSFEVEYLDVLTIHGSPVSSSRIREKIQNGYLDEVEELLGRKYSIFATAQAEIDTKKIKLNVSGLCLPPCKTYAVQVRVEDMIFSGEASLSLDENKKSHLEVLLLQPPEYPLNGKDIEVIFYTEVNSKFDFWQRKSSRD